MGILIKSFSTQPSLVALARAALSKVFNPSNYYNKSEVDARVNARQPDVHLTATDKNTLMYNNAGNQVTQERELLSIRATRLRAPTHSPKEITTSLAENAVMSADTKAGQAASGLSRTGISAKPQEKTPSLWALLFRHRTMVKLHSDASTTLVPTYASVWEVARLHRTERISFKSMQMAPSTS